MSKMKEQYGELWIVQHQLDYWLEEGGTYDELKKQIGMSIRDITSSIVAETYKPGWNDILGYTNNLNTWVTASEQLEVYHREQEKKLPEITSAAELLQDYGLTVGQLCAEGEERVVSPLTYLEEFLEMAYQPPKEVCREFLLTFYRNDIAAIEAFMDSVVWEEDEE